MEKQLYENLSLKLPDNFRTMTQDEINTYYNNTIFDEAFLEPEQKAVLGIVKNQNELKPEQVGKRIAEYQASYARMAPGFVMGELLEKKGNVHHAGILTFKSNAPARDLYNIVSIMDFEGKELFLTFSCDLQNAQNFMYVILNTIEDIFHQIEAVE